MPAPRFVIVGRPNVGKSSLLNMLASDRVAIVDDQPGVTRDRLSTLILLEPMDVKAPGPMGKPVPVEFVDTGGFGVYVAEGARYDEVGADLATLTPEIEEQIGEAVASADVVLFCIDTQAGLTPRDWEIAKLLREGKYGRRRERPDPERRPLIRVLATKVDGPKWEVHAYEFSALGFDEPLMCSAKNNYLRRTLNEQLHEIAVRVVQADPERFAERPEAEVDLRIAIVGKRNSGKSTLVNRLAGEERVIVSEIAGTTRDAIDVRIELPDGRSLMAIDTAGLRRKKSFQSPVEWYAFDRAQRAVARADVVLLLIDALADISQVDEQLGQLITDAYKPVVIVINKWDLTQGQSGRTGQPITTADYEQYVRKELRGLAFAPIAFMSAQQGLNVHGVIDLAFDLNTQASTRVGTGELNRLLRSLVEARHPSGGQGTIGKVYYASQVKTNPPTIVCVVNKPELFHGDYERFLLNRFRENLPFDEVPIRILFRDKKRAERALAERQRAASKSGGPKRPTLHPTLADGTFADEFAPGLAHEGFTPDDDLDQLLLELPDDSAGFFDE